LSACGVLPDVGPLTRRQQEIVLAILDGASNREIATRLGVSEQTIKNQLTVIFHKTGTSSRLELALLAARTRRLTISG
jgi:DNA-binding NarL/FixJ family response regulator